MIRKTVPLALSVCAVLLSGCASDEIVEVTEGFFGSVAVDEPRAAVVARDVLVEGGTAADAAVSAYFTLAVTLPSSAGLGTGGSCVVFDPQDERYEQIDFLPRPAGGSGNGISVPLAPRAMFALHARYGELPIGVLIGGAENLARFGAPVSRKLARDIANDGASLTGPSAGTGDTLTPNGKLVAAGEPLVQIDLASTLGRMRAAGVGDLYSGQLARRFMDAAKAQGYEVDPETLRAAVPTWHEAGGAEYADHIWAVAAGSKADQAYVTKMLSVALNEGEWGKSPDVGDPLMLAEMSVRSANAVANGDVGATADDAEALFADFDPGARRTAPTPGAASLFGGQAHAGATSFTITDRRGLTVGCAMTLNAPFGTGKLLPEMGFFPALAHPSASGPMALAVVAGNSNAWQVHLTGMATGGRPAASALVSSIARSYVGEQEMVGAVAVPRTHLDPASGIIDAESGITRQAAESASKAGYNVEPAPAPLGTVRLFRCAGGYPKGEDDCGVADDPRGLGLILFEAFQ